MAHSNQRAHQSLSPSAAAHPYANDASRRNSARSTGGSSSANSRGRQTTGGHSSIQMEPRLQALLSAEGQAAEMIAVARVKRHELMSQARRESQIELEAFRQNCETRYQLKLHEATKMEEFQRKIDSERRALLEKMAKDVKRERRALLDYILSCVVDHIPTGPHPNTKRVLF